MNLTIYTIAFNEEILLPFTIEWYRTRFPNCKIVVYDNESTDRTVEIAKDNSCQVISFSTNNQFSDKKHLEIKNNCWKNSQSDWVLVCDLDELLDITESDLSKEKYSPIIRTEAYHMINLNENPSCEINLETIKYGFRAWGYDKYVLFNKKYITDMNYSPGCHTADPIIFNRFKLNSRVLRKVFDIYWSKRSAYKLCHFKYLSEDYIVNRHNLFRERLSEENLINEWGNHYLDTTDKLRNSYKEFQRLNLVKLLD